MTRGRFQTLESVLICSLFPLPIVSDLQILENTLCTLIKILRSIVFIGQLALFTGHVRGD